MAAARTSYSRLPPYYASTVEGSVVRYVWKGSQDGSTVLGRYIKVRATATGKLVTTISPPKPYNNFILLTGTADGRTFIFGAERYLRSPSQPAPQLQHRPSQAKQP